jgi:lipoyl(octanoyl) transferase
MKQRIVVKDLGKMGYQEAWDYQEHLLRQNVEIKSGRIERQNAVAIYDGDHVGNEVKPTTNYLLFVEHPPVYTLGKSGNPEHVLMKEEERRKMGIDFFHTNRGGDITFHGPGQIVGYPILDLENFFTDIGRYLRSLEEVIIRTLADYGMQADRSKGETGVWIDANTKGRERKICAMGVRCSRWITMHGFALNVNTDLSYFNGIIPCGIPSKQVTSITAELGGLVPLSEVKDRIKNHFADVFDAEIQ